MRGNPTNLLVRIEVYRPALRPWYSWRKWADRGLQNLLDRVNGKPRNIVHRHHMDPRLGKIDIEIGGPGTSVVGGSDDCRYRFYGYTLQPHTSERVES